MKKICLVLVFVLIGLSGQAQETKCDCSITFEDMIQKLEDNYIGLAQIRKAGHSQIYEAKKKDFKNNAASITGEKCTAFLQKFLKYFDDGHLFVYEQPKYSKEEISKNTNEIKSNKVKTEQLHRLVELESNIIEQNNLDGIVGYWTDGKSEFAIVKDEGGYKAYILKSNNESAETGEIKAIFSSTDDGFEGTYYSYGYAPRYVEGNIYKENSLLVYTGGNYWAKLGPDTSREINMVNKQEPNLPTIHKIDNKNTLFSIPSFLADYQQFVKVITDNLEILKNTTNLIIDIRGNIGGNAMYFTFIDLYANQPLKSSQGLVLASVDTKTYFERLAQNAPEVYGPVVTRIENNLGSIIDGPMYPEKSFEPFESKIKNVAILTDNACMSAAESFVLHSKEVSTKVRSFGQPTKGVIDYTSVNSIKLESGTQNIYFGYPTSTLHKKIPLEGYNKTGIVPDVNIPTGIKDKVAFIIEYYNSSN